MFYSLHNLAFRQTFYFKRSIEESIKKQKKTLCRPPAPPPAEFHGHVLFEYYYLFNIGGNIHCFDVCEYNN
jgi:hypothetical protein